MATIFQQRRAYDQYVEERSAEGQKYVTFEEFVRNPPREESKKTERPEDDGQATLRKIIRFADGGLVKGAGTETSDSILAHLSTNEYVVPADVVAAIGVNTLDNLVKKFHTPVRGGTK